MKTKLFAQIIILTIFLDGFKLFTEPFECFAYYILYVLVVFIFIISLLRGFKIDKYIINFFLILLIIYLIAYIKYSINSNPQFLLIKQITGISVTLIVFYFLIKHYDHDIKELFRIYLSFCFVISLIGIFQEISYFFDFKLGYDYSYFLNKWWIASSQSSFLRINSIFSEPSNFAIVISPAMFIALKNLLSKEQSFHLSKFKSSVILISYFFTFSLLGYLGFFIAILILFYRHFLTKKFEKVIFTLILPIMMLAFLNFIYKFIPDVWLRLDDIGETFKGGEATSVSFFALYSNWQIAIKSFLENPIFGSGLGSHQLIYDKYIFDMFDIEKIKIYTTINREEAGSLFLRLLTETGLTGLGMFLYFVFRFHIKNRDIRYHINSNLLLINDGIFILILLRIVRAGHYFNAGLAFFILVYYLSHKKYTTPQNLGRLI